MKAAPLQINQEHKKAAPRRQSSASASSVEIPSQTIRKAWFTKAHLVLAPGSRILDMGSGDGAQTYAMAAMNPDMEFVGIDRDRQLIKLAQEQYSLPNLQYICGDVLESFIPKNSVDAVINSFILHEIYSFAQCNEKVVTHSLQRQFDLLKPGGLMFIQDHVMPSRDFMLLEMPEKPGGSTLEDMSEIDLLLNYSERARPRHDESYRGFYLEELPARFPRTRLFRLPAKWAHEFILRKDDRDSWNEELGTEYTFYTETEFRRSLRSMGLRVLYTAPHWDEQIVRHRFDKKFKLYDEQNNSLGAPPTSFVAVAQKAGDRESLIIQERKPGRNKDKNPLRITAMRDETNGRILDVLTRDIEITEILPYRITEEGRLHVFVHEGVPRCISNAVPRGVPNLDGKRWSGHMIEALSVPQEIIQEIVPNDLRSLVRFSQNTLNLKPVVGGKLEDGPGFYPAPDHIDERIETKYLRVESPERKTSLGNVIDDIGGFSTRGNLKEIDGQTILNAVGVGFIPSSRLEIQILGLYEKLGVSYQTWSECPLSLPGEDVGETTKLEEIINKLANKDHRFREVRGTAGQLKVMQSMFVDEGQAGGGVTGLASREVSFVVPEQEHSNVAVILPLTRRHSGEVMAGIIEQYLPVPQRYKGNGYVVNCPSLPLPNDVTNMDLARKYIAEKFEVPIECVSKMGESYFCHVGVTPRRIYPFAVSTAGAVGWMKMGRTHGATLYAPLVDLHNLLYLDNYDSFMKIVGLVYTSTIGQDSDMSYQHKFSTSMELRMGRAIGVHGTAVESAKPANESKPLEDSAPAKKYDG